MRGNNTLGFYKGSGLLHEGESLFGSDRKDRQPRRLVLLPHGSGTLMYEKQWLMLFRRPHQFYTGSFDQGSFHGEGSWTLGKKDFFGFFDLGQFKTENRELSEPTSSGARLTCTYKGSFQIREDYSYSNSTEDFWKEYKHMIIPNGHGSLEIRSGQVVIEAYKGEFLVGYYHGEGELTRGSEMFSGRFEWGALR